MKKHTTIRGETKRGKTKRGETRGGETKRRDTRRGETGRGRGGVGGKPRREVVTVPANSGVIHLYAAHIEFPIEATNSIQGSMGRSC